MRQAENTKKHLLDTSELLRMPWTNSDNAFSWLEITHRCNLDCGYCYQQNLPNSDKSISQVKKEIEILAQFRRSDTMIISGGEPLLHPRLEEIVRMVKSKKFKPVLVTNGHILTEKKVENLKKAGLFGFVFHVDSGQSRPGWIDQSEKELNKPRQHYTDMVFKAKGLVCGFNTTILPETRKISHAIASQSKILSNIYGHHFLFSMESWSSQGKGSDFCRRKIQQ